MNDLVRPIRSQLGPQAGGGIGVRHPSIGYLVVRDRDGLQKGLEANAAAIRSLEVETVKSLAAVREQLVETNANLKNLIAETRQDRPK